MKPYYSDASVTIYHADCRELLPLPADLILTDIPYGVVSRPSSGLRHLDKGRADVETFVVDEIMPLLIKSQARSQYIWCAVEQMSAVALALTAAQYTIRLGVWVK